TGLGDPLLSPWGDLPRAVFARFPPRRTRDPRLGHPLPLRVRRTAITRKFASPAGRAGDHHHLWMGLVAWGAARHAGLLSFYRDRTRAQHAGHSCDRRARPPR